MIDVPGRARLRYGYWAVAFALLSLLAFSTVPSPLYGLYARRDDFSSLVITLIYAAYVLGVIASLFLAGHLSDSYGRRPLLLAALALDAGSALVFLLWPALPGLFVARVLTGLSVGVTSSTATAYLCELSAARCRGGSSGRAQLLATSVTLGGFGTGALVAGLLAEYEIHPLRVPYLVLLATFAVAAAGIVLAPETRSRPEPMPAYRPQRLSVPSRSRPAFLAALLGVALVFAVLGMVVGLAGTFLLVLLRQPSLAVAGEAISLVFAVGVCVAVATNGWRTRSLLLLSVPLMLVGLAALVVAAWLPDPSLALFLAGGALIGGGAAATFRGTLAVVVAVSPPEQRAEVLAGFFLAGYVGVSLPVIALGVALQRLSVRATLLWFAAAIAVGLLAATPTLLRGGGSEPLRR